MVLLVHSSTFWFLLLREPAAHGHPVTREVGNPEEHTSYAGSTVSAIPSLFGPVLLPQILSTGREVACLQFTFMFPELKSLWGQ